MIIYIKLGFGFIVWLKNINWVIDVMYINVLIIVGVKDVEI